MVTGVSVQAHGVCGDEFVFHLRMCVCVCQCMCICVCVFVCLCLRISDAWHGDETRTVTVSQVGSVSKFNVLLISSPAKRAERQTDREINQKKSYLVFSSVIFALYIAFEA